MLPPPRLVKKPKQTTACPRDWAVRSRKPKAEAESRSRKPKPKAETEAEAEAVAKDLAFLVERVRRIFSVSYKNYKTPGWAKRTPAFHTAFIYSLILS